MLESLKIIKDEGQKIKHLLKPLTLTNIKSLNKNLHLVHNFLEFTDTTLGQNPIKQQNWNIHLYATYIIPALTQFYYLRECLAIYTEYEVLQPVCPRTYFENKAKSYLQFITADVMLQSQCVELYNNFTAAKLAKFESKYDYNKIITDDILKHPFKHLTNSVTCVAYYNGVYQMKLPYAILLRLYRANRVIVPTLNWHDNKTKFVSLIYSLNQQNLISANDNTIKGMFESLAKVFDLSLSNVYKLYLDANYWAIKYVT